MADLVLMSTSPRKRGNCDDALDIVVRELASKGCEAEAICLRESKIERCRGCLRCQKGKDCRIRDDFPALWQRVKDAARIVYFIPVYWLAPPGLMKDFIDRTVVDFSAGGVMAGKEIHLISVAQSAGFGPHEEMVETWIKWLGGSPLKTKMRLIAFHKGELAADPKAEKELVEFADRLAAGSAGTD